MAIYHISGLGSDSNDGLTKNTAFRTIQYALSQVSEYSTIYVHKGIYYGYWGALPEYNLDIIGLEANKFDLQGAANAMSFASTVYTVSLQNLDFYDWGGMTSSASQGFFYGGYQANGRSFVMSNCVIARTGAYYKQGSAYLNFTGANSLSQKQSFINCTFFGLYTAQFNSSAISEYANCLMLECSLGLSNGCYARYCALDPYTTTPLGAIGNFSAVTYAPPAVSHDNTSPDFRYDSSATNYTKYLTEGEYGHPIGALRGLGASGANIVNGAAIWGYSNQDWRPQIDMDQTRPLGAAWANNTNAFDKTFETQSVSTGVDDKVDFIDDGGTHAATLSDGTYASGASWATEIQTQMNNVASDTITATYNSDTGKLNLSSDGTTFELSWNTGANSATSAATAMGFDATADSTGDLAYTSDYTLFAGGDPYVAPVVWNDSIRGWEMDLTVVGDATTSEVVSPVFDQQKTRTAKYLFGQEDLDGTGSIAYYFRTSDTSFSQQDATPSWVSATAGTEITSSNTGRYIQYKAVLSI